MQTQTQVNQLNFTGQNIYAGIDVHKKCWKVSIMLDTIEHKTFSQPPDPEKLYKYLKSNFPGGNYHTAYESGFCGFWIHEKLEELGIKSIVVNPADIPTTDKEKKQKTDSRDCRKIAKELRSNNLDAIYTPSRTNQEDRSLLRIRSTIVKDLVRLKNRIRMFLYYYGIDIPEAYSGSKRWTRRFVEWLESVELQETSGKESLQKMIEILKFLRTKNLEITRSIRTLSRSKRYIKQVELLTSIPGIALLSAMIILTEIGSIIRFKNLNYLCSYIGIIPTTRSSGEKNIIGEMTPRGNNFLRRTIIESSWIAVKNDPALLMKYNELCKRMQPNKAIIRISRKYVNRIRSVLINQKKYENCIVK